MRVPVLALLFLLTPGVAGANKPGQRMNRPVMVGDVIRSPVFGRLQSGWTWSQDRRSVPAYTPRFASANFVVEDARMAHGGADPVGGYPRGLTVLARELHENGTYNPEGATLEFMQSENHTENVPPREITLVKQMIKTFVDLLATSERPEAPTPVPQFQQPGRGERI